LPTLAEERVHTASAPISRLVWLLVGGVVLWMKAKNNENGTLLHKFKKIVYKQSGYRSNAKNLQSFQLVLRLLLDLREFQHSQQLLEVITVDPCFLIF